MYPHSCPFTGFSFTENQRGEAPVGWHWSEDWRSGQPQSSALWRLVPKAGG